MYTMHIYTHELYQRAFLAVVSKFQGLRDRSKLAQCLEHSLLVLCLLEHSQQSWGTVERNLTLKSNSASWFIV